MNESAFNDWKFGTFYDNCSFTSLATGTYNVGSCIFGLASCPFIDFGIDEENVFTNWTAEFYGSQTLVAMVFGLDDYIQVGTLGGISNKNMRFYFNASEGDDSSVVIAAMKLAYVSEDYILKFDKDALKKSTSGGRNNILAIALGKGFQLNLGRTREKGNDDATGGNTFPGGGTMHIFGGIGRALLAEDYCTGSIMRIDGNWHVKCYAPITDLSAIHILNGTLELRSCSDGVGCETQIKSNINLVQYGSIFNESEGIDSYKVIGFQGDDSGITDFSKFDSTGTLTLGANQSLCFGVSIDEETRKQNLAGMLCFRVDDKLGNKIIFEGGRIGLILNNKYNLNYLGPENEFEFPIIIANDSLKNNANFPTKFKAIFQGLTLGNPVELSSGYYYVNTANKLIIDNNLTPYTQYLDAKKLRLLCKETTSSKGDEKSYTLVLTNRDIVKELDELKIKHDNDIDAIKSAYLTKSDASSTYLSKSDASSTYLKKTDASNAYQAKGDYLTPTGASETYQAKGDYLTATDASETYLSQDTAATTYVTQDALLAAIAGNEESPTEGGTFTELLGEKLAGYVTKNELSEIFSENSDSDFDFVKDIARKLDGYVTEEELISALKDV
ncbi:MAG: hypothetical protein LBI69_03925, partial [Puniceicoccales bacterium]|nr:hypothetical protein [Puniceicoccales bacterium]